MPGERFKDQSRVKKRIWEREEGQTLIFVFLQQTFDRHRVHEQLVREHGNHHEDDSRICLSRKGSREEEAQGAFVLVLKEKTSQQRLVVEGTESQQQLAWRI
jgi:hypothetical protein